MTPLCPSCLAAEYRAAFGRAMRVCALALADLDAAGIEFPREMPQPSHYLAGALKRAGLDDRAGQVAGVLSELYVIAEQLDAIGSPA